MYGYGLRQFGNGTGSDCADNTSKVTLSDAAGMQEGDGRNSMRGGEWWEGGNSVHWPVFGGTWCWRDKGVSARPWGGAVG